MSNSVLNFYEQLASSYHLIFPDWQTSLLRQAEILDSLIRKEMQQFPLSLLDCSCGIGTQAIGLAKRGYQVHATDLSAAAVERAKAAAQSFGVSLTFGVADLRSLRADIQGEFDIVISCDNALPHLLTDEDLCLAASNIWSKLKHNGLIVASIRDYDQAIQEKPRSTVPQIIDTPEGRRIIFQVWDWLEEENTYQVHLFIVQELEGCWQTQHYTTEYRVLLRNEITSIFEDAGFADIRWQMPEETGYYQPIVIGRKY